MSKERVNASMEKLALMLQWAATCVRIWDEIQEGQIFWYVLTATTEIYKEIGIINLQSFDNL